MRNLVAVAFLASLLCACGNQERDASETAQTDAPKGAPSAAPEPTPPAEPAWVDHMSLPSFSAARALPPADESIVVRIDRQGYLRTDGPALALQSFQADVRKRADQFHREPDGASPLPVVFYVDNGTCWRAVQWLMQACAHPNVKIYKLVFAGRHDGTGKLGGIDIQLPKDRGLAPTAAFPAEFEKIKLKFFAYDGVPEDPEASYLAFRRAVYASVMARREALRKAGVHLDEVKGELVAPPPKGGLVHTGYIVQALDATLRAGFTDLVFEGAAMPLYGRRSNRIGPDRAGDPSTDPEAFAQKARVSGKGHVKFKLDNSSRHTFHSKNADGPALPAGPFDDTPHARLVRRASDPDTPPGAPMVTASTQEVIEEELEEIEEETEEIKESDITSEAPVIKDEEIADHVETDNEMPYEESFGESEGLSDAPFEGPANNGTIGIGGGAGGAFMGRGGKRDLKPASGVRRKKFDDGVDNALRWLAAHQSPNGGWEAANFGSWCEGKGVEDRSKRPDGAGKSLHDPGVTGLALCAYLGAGYTNRGKHDFAKVVSRGLRYLKNIQDPEGCFGPRTHDHYIYGHAAAALAMVEAYGMTGSPIFKGSAQRALDFIALSRNPYFAWRYGIKPGDNDTAVTCWMMMAIKSAQIINKDAVARGKPAPLVVDESAFEGIKTWLDKVTDLDTGRVGYQMRGSGSSRPKALVERFPAAKSEALTAAAILARMFMGEDPRTSRIIRKGADLCVKKLPTWNTADGSIDMHYWYYGSLAMFQVGGDHWAAWQGAMEKAILENQRKDTTFCEYKGSWNPVGPWGPDGGRVYSTAYMALCLEVFYRYDKVFGK